MTVKTEQFRAVLPWALFLLPPLLASAGCVKTKTAVETSYIQQLEKASSAHAGKKEFGDAAEDLKIVLTIDPDDSKTEEYLQQLQKKRYAEADRHMKAGLAAMNSNPQKAKEELLDALRLCCDNRQALAALRELHYEWTDASLQSRIKKEAKVASLKIHEREQSDEDDVDTGDYSLDVAVSSFEDGDYSTAIRQFEKMKARFPNDSDIQMYINRCWYNIGTSYFSKKEYRKALSSFSRVRKGFERVDDYIAKCRQALASSRAR